MSVSLDVRELHDAYEESYPSIHEAVDEAFDAVHTVFYDHGLNAATDDRAEILVARIYQYLIDSVEAQ